MRATLEREMERLFAYPSEEEIQHRWRNAREAIQWQAVAASARSVSYRPFPVGCMVMAYKETHDPQARWGYFRGANIKAAKETPKICAEMTAIMGAMQQGYTRIVGMVIVGQPQPDQGSGKLSETLHPCESCRAAFKVLPVVTPCTHVLMARPLPEDRFTCEEMTVAELEGVHMAYAREHGDVK
jgi:cytidine deaminase